MPQLDLGRVKGDPFLYEDLTEEQKLELKGEKGDMPIVKAGTTTIVEYEQGAKVTSETNGDVTSFNFQIPIGQKPPFYGAYADFPEVGDSNRTYIDDTVDPRLMYTWDDTTQAYVLTGGAGGADGGSVDIPITLTSADWTGTTAPYQQTVTLPQMREGMTPLYFLASDGDDAQYAFGLIIDYQVGYAEITFYAADRPAVDLNLTLKGIPAQEMEYVDNTVVFLVEPSAFALNSTTQRYEATIPVEGMTAGTGGTWDIVRSGPVLTEVESNIALHITDVDRLDGAVKISCLEVPEQRYMMSISGAYPDAEPGTIILANMQEWFDRVNSLNVLINSPVMRRTVYRGINLGSEFTDAQKAAIRDGTFEGLYLGDYWSIRGSTWRIVDFNYWLNTGDVPCILPHLVIMPDALLYSSKMNETDTTDGGYVGSQMYTTNLENAKAIINAAFGDANILNHREYLTNAVSNGHSSASAWYDSTVELPNEIMMYGSFVFTPAGDGSFVPNLYTIDKTQLALMKTYPRFINPNQQTNWLRDVVSSNTFARIEAYGITGSGLASASRGVRPVFGLIG